MLLGCVVSNWTGVDGTMRSPWLVSYTFLYTTRRLQIQLCLIRNKIEIIKLLIYS